MTSGMDTVPRSQSVSEGRSAYVSITGNGTQEISSYVKGCQERPPMHSPLCLYLQIAKVTDGFLLPFL